MQQPLVILHLSDAHMGNPRTVQNSHEVLKPLLSDLKVMTQKLGQSPDLIIFSGDIAFGEVGGSTLVSQYEQADEFIKKIYEAIGATNADVPLITVPGNHDVDRTRVAPDQEIWLDGLKGAPGASKLDDLMYRGDIQWQRILERQSQYREFAQRTLPPDSLDVRFNLTKVVISKHSRDIGVIGANSSWACSRDSEEGKLWIGRRQAEHAWQAVNGCALKVFVSHHPLSWLNEAEQSWLIEKISTHFHLHLHGHTHSQWLSSDQNHIRVGAGASYAGTDTANAYSWIKIDLANGDVEIHLREYTDKGSGGWKPLVIPSRTGDDGRFLAPNKFQLYPGEASSSSDQNSKASPQSTSVKGVFSLNRFLEDRFNMRWEPSSYSEGASTLVYWPVRLRAPTPIHAVQAFVAAALQKQGAQIALYLDDLGNAEGNIATFTSAVESWFARVGADQSLLRVVTFSSIINDKRAADAWLLVRKWLAETQYRLDTVVEISKLSPTGPEPLLQRLLEQRPRRLLTPPLVWMCLDNALSEQPDRQVITLGGYDEVKLWKVWRDSIKAKGAAVGHLYVPILKEALSSTENKTVHMASRHDLAWSSREDIEQSLRREIEDVSASESWLEPGRIFEWCLRGTILLPAYVKDSENITNIGGVSLNPFTNLGDLRDKGLQEVKDDIAKAVASWVL